MNTIKTLALATIIIGMASCASTQRSQMEGAFGKRFYIIGFAAKREIILLHLNGTCYFGFSLGYLGQGDV